MSDPIEVVVKIVIELVPNSNYVPIPENISDPKMCKCGHLKAVHFENGSCSVGSCNCKQFDSEHPSQFSEYPGLVTGICKCGHLRRIHDNDRRCLVTYCECLKYEPAKDLQNAENT